MTASQRPQFRSLSVRRQGAVITLALDRPERDNALHPMLINELLWAFDDARDDPEVRVVVLAGKGDAFCAGADLGHMGSGEEAELPLAVKGDLCDLLARFPKLHKPVIARVHGAALGGGLGLVASCDFAIAAESAQLGTPEILRGLFPMQIMAVLDRLVPPRQLLELMLLGKTIDARTAKELGLITQVVADDRLDAAVDELAQQLAERSPTAMRMGLEAYVMQHRRPMEESLPYLRAQLMNLLATEDGMEGLAAYLEQRPPRWRNR